MFRRLNHGAATVVGCALASATAASGSSSHLHATERWAMGSPAAASWHVSARGFIKIRMVKSPNDPSNSSEGSSSGPSDNNAGGDSTSPTASSGVANATGGDDDFNIEWDSKDFYKRMGLKRDCTDKEIRARYIELAKRYHPDLANSSASLPKGVKPEEVFKNIKEAYEALNNPQSREYINQRGSEEYQERQQSGYGVSPEEYARQQAIKQLFSDGLPFFIASVGLFLFAMAYHFKSRIDAGGLLHFFVILLVLSFFPRILAAALMYLMHCNDMIAVFEKEAQAASIVTVTATQSGAPVTTKTTTTVVEAAAPAVAAAAAPADGKAPARAAPAPKPKTVTVTTTTLPMNVAIRAEGIDPKHIPEGNLVVRIRRAGSATAADTAAAAVPAKEGEEEEVFVFAKGVTAVTIPLMMPADAAALPKAGGLPAPFYEMDVRFVNDKLKLTLMEKKAFL